MGWTYEVKEWHEVEKNNWQYTARYQGESLIKAVYVMVKLKRNNCGCVKLEWR